MPSEFVRTISAHNITTYYLLPLIQLSKFSFGEANFIDSYVTPDGSTLIVEVIDLRLSPDFTMHPEFKSESDGTPCMILFELPDRWRPDFELFKLGKYSQMSEQAKIMIYQFSQLSYRSTVDDGREVTDARLLALTKADILREKWVSELGLDERGNAPLPEDLELMSIPTERCFRIV